MYKISCSTSERKNWKLDRPRLKILNYSPVSSRERSKMSVFDLCSLFIKNLYSHESRITTLPQRPTTNQAQRPRIKRLD